MIRFIELDEDEAVRERQVRDVWTHNLIRLCAFVGGALIATLASRAFDDTSWVRWWHAVPWPW